MASEIVQKETRLANGWLAWRVEGRIDISNAESVYLSGEKIVEREDKTVLDMEALSYISSAGLRVLLRLFKKANEILDKINISQQGAENLKQQVAKFKV